MSGAFRFSELRTANNSDKTRSAAQQRRRALYLEGGVAALVFITGPKERLETGEAHPTRLAHRELLRHVVEGEDGESEACLQSDGLQNKFGLVSATGVPGVQSCKNAESVLQFTKSSLS